MAQALGIAFLLHGFSGYTATRLSLWLMTNKTRSASLKQLLPNVFSEAALAGFIRQGLNTLEQSLRRPGGIRQLYKLGDAVIPTLLADFVSNTLGDLEHGYNRHLKELLYQFYKRALPKLRLDYTEADFAVSMVFSTLVTPAYIRNMLIETLTPERIAGIEESVLAQMPFWQSLVAKLIDIKKPLTHLRDYMVQHPLEAERLIIELLDQLEVREHLAEAIAGFTPETLDTDTQEALAQYLTTTTGDLLVDHRDNLRGLLENLSTSSTRVLSKALMKADYKKWLLARYPNYDETLAQWLSGRMLAHLDTQTLLNPVLKPLCHTLSMLVALFSGLLGVLLAALI